MDLSGIIFVILALAWAVYLIPKAVKHHDEVAPTRSVDRFNTAMSVLARREPDDRRNARVVVAPPRATERVLVPSRPEPEGSGQGVRRRRGAARAAARAAARRRRHVTIFLVAVDVVVVALCALGLSPWWSVAIPVALTLLYLALCRRQVRREHEALWASADEPGPAVTVSRRAVRVDAAYGAVQHAGEALAESSLPADDTTMQIPVTDAEAVAVTVETADGGSLWDPLPVTLPTYVNKARATRTVRTIDLGAPGTWSSGRVEADAASVEEPVSQEYAEEQVEHEQRRAVGS